MTSGSTGMRSSIMSRPTAEPNGRTTGWWEAPIPLPVDPNLLFRVTRVWRLTRAATAIYRRLPEIRFSTSTTKRLFSEPRASRDGNSRNVLQIVFDFDAVPAGQESFDFLDNGPTNFQNQPASRPKFSLSLRNKARNYFGTDCAGKDGAAWFKFADLQLNHIRFRFADIGRVRDNKVEFAGYAFQ